MSLPTLKRCGVSFAKFWDKMPGLLLDTSFCIALLCIIGVGCHSLNQGNMDGDILTLVTASLTAYMAYQAMIWRNLRYRLDWTPAEVDPSDPDYQRCYRLLGLAAQRLGLPTPLLVIYKDQISNACAGMNAAGDPFVGVTMGMLDTHTDAELLATLGHEMAHHANGDINPSLSVIYRKAEVLSCAHLLSGLLLVEALITPLCALNHSGVISFLLLLPILTFFLNGLSSAYQLAAIYRRQEYAADIGAMQAQPHLYVNKQMLLNVCGDEQRLPPQNWQEKTGYWLGVFFGGYARTHPLLWQRFQNLERHAATIAADS